tara:strand:+ start:874 stop:1026 length:153 start_codon:yes stop_codon:yes gene_type:complete
MAFPRLPLLITALNREVQGGDPVNLSGFPSMGMHNKKISESPIIFLSARE